MLSRKKFINNYTQYPEMARACLTQSGEEWKDLVSRPYDFRDPSAGSVSGFIYYLDTLAFARKHLLQIIGMLHDFEEECGVLENKPNITRDGEDYYLNWLAWFAWETIMQEIIYALEDQ